MFFLGLILFSIFFKIAPHVLFSTCPLAIQLHMFQIPIDADFSTGFDYQYEISMLLTIYDDKTEVTRTDVVEVVDVNKPSKGK